MSLVLFGLLSFGSGSLAGSNYAATDAAAIGSFFRTANSVQENDLFFSQQEALNQGTPDLKIIEENSLAAVSTPSVLNTQTLGDMFGGIQEERTGIVDHHVELGDTVSSVAQKYGITPITLALANEISKNAALKVDQSLIIPPVDGVFYIVKSGDTVSDIAKRYKSSVDKIISFNNLKNEGDIFKDDDIFLPGGQIPPKAAPSVIVQIPVATTFFIYPTQGKVSQGPHGFLGRGIDVANKCGTPVYAAASGVVQRSQFNPSYGNFVTIAHTNGTSTYYGHLQALLVSPGQNVAAGHMIGLIGRTGTAATGCHLHFEVRGAKNFLAGLSVVSFK